MKTKLGIVVVILGLAMGAGAYWWSSTQDRHGAQGPAEQGKMAPEFSLPDTAANRRTLEEFRGKWVILHFWAKWCAPCIEELPVWIDLAHKYSDAPIQWVAVSLDSKWEEAFQIFPKEALREKLVLLLDDKQVTPSLFGSYQFPETYVIDPEGRIVEKWVGAQDWNSSAIQTRLNQWAVTRGE